MSRWQRVIEALFATNSISQAGVFDHDGNCLAASKDLQLQEKSAKALITAFGDSSGILFGIHVGQELFKCYRAGEKVMIGQASDSYGNTTTFACMLSHECLIFCVMSSASCSSGGIRGSVISVMKAAVSNSIDKPISSATLLPVDCRVQIMNDELPLIDLEIR